MVERVTVAVDGGPASDAALRWVIERAQTVDLRLEITTVVGLDDEHPAGTNPAGRSPCEGALLKATATVRSLAPHITVTTKLRRGAPAAALLSASRHADLLVVGANKTARLVGVAHGTLPLKVAGQAECITVVVPANWQPRTGAVVVGWTSDATADQALDFAAQEADRSGTSLTIVHAWNPTSTAPLDGGASALLVDELLQVNRELLAEAARRVRRSHGDIAITEGMVTGSPAVAIVDTAASASLIVVGSRGLRAIAGFFLGSVSNEILLTTPAPVAVVPKKPTQVNVYPELIDEDA